MPLFHYFYAVGALDRLAANQVAWQAVMYVLDVAQPSFQERIGSSVLRYIAADARGHLLMVTLVEQPDADDVYDIFTARYLDAEESAAASTLLTPRENR